MNLLLDLIKMRMNVCSCNIRDPCPAETLVESVCQFSHAVAHYEYDYCQCDVFSRI